jgi:hypothetical protein
MKTLNDSLREEFSAILKDPDIENMINVKKLDNEIVSKAFEKLLANKYGADESALVDKGRAEFETYIINTLRTKTH